MSNILNKIFYLFSSSKSVFTTDTIAKYMPDRYDENGRYLIADWTSVSDTCHKENNWAIYRSTENQYVNAIVDICEIAHCHFLTMIPLSEDQTQLYTQDNLAIEDEVWLRNRFETIRRQKWISINDIDVVVKLSLREELNVCLINQSKHILAYFGYDYYMYVMNNLDYSVLNQIVRKNKLYLNPRLRFSLDDVLYDRLRDHILNEEGEFPVSVYAKKELADWYLYAQFVYCLAIKILNSVHSHKHCYVKFITPTTNFSLKSISSVCPLMVICRTLPQIHQYEHLNNRYHELNTSLLDFYHTSNEYWQTIYMIVPNK